MNNYLSHKIMLVSFKQMNFKLTKLNTTKDKIDTICNLRWINNIQHEKLSFL
jgi:hypothetical protein